MMRQALLWASENKTLRGTFPKHKFAQAAVRKFMSGEKVEDALREATRLNAMGAGVLLTRLGENVLDKAAAQEVADHYSQVFAVASRAARCAPRSRSSPHHLGLDLPDGLDLCNSHIDRLCADALKNNNVLWIDIESSTYVDVTLDLFRHATASCRSSAWPFRPVSTAPCGTSSRSCPGRRSSGWSKARISSRPTVAYPKKERCRRELLQPAASYAWRMTTDRARAHVGTHDSGVARIDLTGGRRRRGDSTDRPTSSLCCTGFGAADSTASSRPGRRSGCSSATASTGFPGTCAGWPSVPRTCGSWSR